jgi:hypothetical protein
LDGMDDLGGAGTSAGPGCTESCCLDYQGCMSNAKSNYVRNYVFYVGGGMFTGAAAGFALGTYVPGIGNLIGATGGAFYGSYLTGTTGYIVAVIIYMNDQKVCALNYKACIQRKNGN